ncbi:M12 family metallo-peptidase [Carboxydothermus islandicus]|uniref:M12 family metallo-peptidase n=1 Tax=Carboxydothermus islandicus TaxID=661089 RepID=UPI001177B1FC|nr:M12 family metallo-peptidase [Carboxydothermus islandicus]
MKPVICKENAKRLKRIMIMAFLSWVLLFSVPVTLAASNIISKPGVYTDPKTGQLYCIVTSDPKGPKPPDPDSLPEKNMKPPILGNNEAYPKAGVYLDPKTGLLVDIVTSDPNGPQPPDPDSLPEKNMKPPILGNNEAYPKAGVYLDPKTGLLVDIVTSDPNGPQPPDPDSQPEKNMKPPILGNNEAFSLFSIPVYINEPCDEEWRARYGTNWMYWANYAVEVADDYLYEQFGIDFYSVAQNVWNSNNIAPGDLLDEAKIEVGLTNGADLMVAFSGQTYGNTLGIAYINKPGSLIFDTGSRWNGIIVRHETGHNYGLAQWSPTDGNHHCTRPTCLMYPILYGPTENTTLCADHRSEWLNKRDRY